jgi:hypothetical protein
MTPLAYSSAFLKGAALGYRWANRSLLRRFLVTFIVTAILWGVSFAVAWEVVDRFSKMESGETFVVAVFHKWDSWWRVHLQP